MPVKHFSEEEVKGLDPALVIKLDQLREHAGIPVIITCGYRSQEHNKEIGGVENSSHTQGLAVDIRCNDSVSRFKLVEAAFAVGFRRIECATKHIHLDISETLPQDVLWLDISK